MKIISGDEIVMAALSQEDYDNWLRALKKLKEETERRRKDIERKHQIMDTAGQDDVILTRSRDEMKTAGFDTIDLGLMESK